MDKLSEWWGKDTTKAYAAIVGMVLFLVISYIVGRMPDKDYPCQDSSTKCRYQRATQAGCDVPKPVTSQIDDEPSNINAIELSLEQCGY